MNMRPLHETFHVKHSVPLIPASFVAGRAWFVVFASSAEMHWGRDGFPVQQRIVAEGFETFVPREIRIIRRNGRKLERVTSLLGSYVFVRFDREKDEWGIINPVDIRGVHCLLRDGNDMPIRVPDMVIDRLQRAEGAGAFDFTIPRAAFREGEDVEILEGPFAGLIAKVRSCEPRKRVKLLLQGLGKLDIDPAYLGRLA